MLQLKKEQKDFSVFNDNCENSLIETLYTYFNLNGIVIYVCINWLSKT